MTDPGLWASRFNTRWRKWWRDPAAFADGLPSPPLRALLLFALGGGTLASDAVDARDWAARREWKRKGVSLVKAHHAFEDFQFRTRDGKAPKRWPKRVLIETDAASAVVVAFMQDGGVMTADEVGPGRPGLIMLGGRPAWCRVYRTDDEAVAPEALAARPVGRPELVRLWRGQGAAYPDALKRVWPPVERRAAEPAEAAYRSWIARNEPGLSEAPAIRAWLAGVEGLPVISVLMPVKDPRPEHLRAAIASVLTQVYSDLRLCIADDGSTSPEVKAVLRDAAQSDARVRLTSLTPSRGVAMATNAALAKAEGDVALFMDHDDVLAPHALAVVGAAFAGCPEAAAVYSDEDCIDASGRRAAPVFKPDLDQERLLAQNYVNHAFAVRLDLLRRLGGLRAGLDGVQDHDLVLRVAESGAGPILHAPHVLYHWRVFPGGNTFSQSAKPEIDGARAAMLQERLEGGAALHPGPRGHVIVERPLPEPAPAVTAIIPTRDRPGLLEACVAGLLEQTDYPSLELLIVDNGSRTERALKVLGRLAETPRVKVLRIDAPFNFAALNNAAVEASSSPVLAFINDDVMVVEPAWLKAMVALAVEPDVGAVGAKLFYPDGRIQHAGIVLGLGPQQVAGHEFRGAPGDSPGPQNRLLIAREVSAVTAACMVCERGKFTGIGGFDQEAFPVAFNDVDLCLRLDRAGFRTVWTPHARLMHLESATRGPDKAGDHRFARDVARMRERWGAALLSDRYYNPNLTLEDESFTLAAQSRARLPWRR
jgi:GT2 family glycosyltransferase